MPEVLSDDELEAWMADVEWVYASTYHDRPALRHEYTLRYRQDPRRFRRVVFTVWHRGYDRWFLRRPWRSLDIGEWYVWIYTDPREVDDVEELLRVTVLINRARSPQRRLFSL